VPGLSGQSVPVTVHDEPGASSRTTKRELELANECVAAAESALATLMPDLAGRLASSPEACGVAMLITGRQLADNIPYYTSQIAGGLVHEALELRWPNWRDGIPLPPSRVCPSCQTELSHGFKRSWQWCPACGNALD
jgi:hypothetical protein